MNRQESLWLQPGEHVKTVDTQPGAVMNCIYEIIPVNQDVEQATAADWIVSDMVDGVLCYYRVNQLCGRELYNWESFEEEISLIRASYNNSRMSFVYCEGITKEVIKFDHGS